MLNLDKIAFLFIIACLTLLWTPASFLLSKTSWFCCILAVFLTALFAYLLTYRRLSLLLSYLLITLCGLAYFQQQALQIYQQTQSIFVENIHTQFRVEDVLHQQGYQTFIAKEQPSGRRLYLQWDSKQLVQAGEIWQGEIRLRPLSSRLNQGGFDRQQWYFANGIVVTAKVKSAVKIRDDFSWREKRLAETLNSTKNLPQQGLLLALGFGERAWLNGETWRVYQQTNTAHLIAISGLHIGLAMLLGFWLGRGLQFVLPTCWISPSFPLFCGVALAALYAELAGFAIPTFRALLALFVVVAVRVGRGYCTAWQYFLRVIALLLICDPLMILSNSFWLSVSAVASLILWYSLFPLSLIYWRGQPWLAQISPKVRWILALFHLQFGLFCCFTPIQLSIFGGVSLYGFWANLFAVPCYSFVLVPIVLFATLTHGACYSWQIADAIADWVTQCVIYFDGGWLTVNENTSQILTALLLLIMLLVLSLLYAKSKSDGKKTWLLQLNPERALPAGTLRRMVWGVIALLVFIMTRLSLTWISEPKWRMETLDVGQGLATLLVKNGHGVLYDTGASWGSGSMAETEILPYLQRQGIVLDWLILSHDDNDHSGGARAVLNAFPAVQFMSPSHKDYGQQNQPEIDRTFCYKGRQWQWQGLQFEVVSPPAVVARANNTDSCVIVVRDEQYRILLTGDADLAAERQFSAHLEQIDVLQVGHHGSKTSTGEDLVQQIKPKLAVISSGRWNPWHFPHHSVTARLQRAQSAVENTAVSGQISVKFYVDKSLLERARTEFSPWFRGFIGERPK